MFTGIIENLGEIVSINIEATNKHFVVKSDFTNELKVDQSIAHNGCCLTVVDLDLKKNTYSVTAIKETLDKTNLGTWKIGTIVNLERCMLMNGRLDGHIVQGHVDVTAICSNIIDENGSWRYTFNYNSPHLTVEKGSITVNGVSLTVVNSKEGSFSVCIIPYTYEHTNFHALTLGSTVNLEFDIIGKYVSQWLIQTGKV